VVSPVNIGASILAAAPLAYASYYILVRDDDSDVMVAIPRTNVKINVNETAVGLMAAERALLTLNPTLHGKIIGTPIKRAIGHVAMYTVPKYAKALATPVARVAGWAAKATTRRAWIGLAASGRWVASAAKPAAPFAAAAALGATVGVATVAVGTNVLESQGVLSEGATQDYLQQHSSPVQAWENIYSPKAISRNVGTIFGHYF
jgi:hypothetical protein